MMKKVKDDLLKKNGDARAKVKIDSKVGVHNRKEADLSVLRRKEEKKRVIQDEYKH